MTERLDSVEEAVDEMAEALPFQVFRTAHVGEMVADDADPRLNEQVAAGTAAGSLPSGSMTAQAADTCPPELSVGFHLDNYIDYPFGDVPVDFRQKHCIHVLATVKSVDSLNPVDSSAEM